MDSGASSETDASDGDRPTKRSTDDGGKSIARKSKATAAAAPEGMLVRGAGAGAGAGVTIKAKVRRLEWGGAPGRLPRAPTAHY